MLGQIKLIIISLLTHAESSMPSSTLSLILAITDEVDSKSVLQFRTSAYDSGSTLIQGEAEVTLKEEISFIEALQGNCSQYCKTNS